MPNVQVVNSSHIYHKLAGFRASPRPCPPSLRVDGSKKIQSDNAIDEVSHLLRNHAIDFVTYIIFVEKFFGSNIIIFSTLIQLILEFFCSSSFHQASTGWVRSTTIKLIPLSSL